jgi:predicted regulator of Ras-like GTPase activity (Roadblock/LC7/MglB family)
MLINDEPGTSLTIQDHQAILTKQGILAYVKVDQSGLAVIVEGQYATQLSEFIGYFYEMANLIGDTFGMDPLEDAFIKSDKINTFCVPLTDNTLVGIITDHGMKPEALRKLLKHGNGNE